MSQFATTISRRVVHSMFTRACVSLLLIPAGACGDSPAAASSPTAVTAPTTTNTFHVTGIATEDDGNPVAGAAVTILNTPVSGITDGSGFYSLDFGASPGTPGPVGFVRAESAGHDTSYTYLSQVSGSRDISQNIHVYRIRRISAGESAALTVIPGDTLCGDNDQFTCRTVHIVAPSDGLMTLDAEPTPSAANAGLEIAGRGATYQCCLLHVSVAATAGAEVVANMGMSWTATASQSFVLRASLVRP